jgi:hypothetical protein
MLFDPARRSLIKCKWVGIGKRLEPYAQRTTLIASLRRAGSDEGFDMNVVVLTPCEKNINMLSRWDKE